MTGIVLIILILTFITLYILHARATSRRHTESLASSTASFQTFIDGLAAANLAVHESLDRLHLTLISSAEKSATATDTHTQAVLQVANSLEPLVNTAAKELQAHMDFIETSQRDLTTRVENATSASSTMRVP